MTDFDPGGHWQPLRVANEIVDAEIAESDTGVLSGNDWRLLIVDRLMIRKPNLQ